VSFQKTNSHQSVLGLDKPWQVHAGKLELSLKRVTVFIERDRGVRRATLVSVACTHTRLNQAAVAASGLLAA
jgi:hypothetical protein